jgi:hypothetical protein
LESARVSFDQKVLEKGRKFNTGYYVAERLDSLSQWRSIEAAGSERKLLVHANNACPHTANLSIQYFNENRMKPAPQPSYSPHLGPPDFYFFEYVKRCLACLSLKDVDQLPAAIDPAAVEGVLEGIEKVSLQAVFLEWMDRLRKCIATNGEYTEYAQTNVIEEWSFILPILRCSCPRGTPCRSKSAWQARGNVPALDHKSYALIQPRGTGEICQIDSYRADLKSSL